MPVSATEKRTRSSPTRGRRQRDPAALFGVGQGVVEQVVEGVAETLRVHADGRQRFGVLHDDLDALGRRARPQLIGRRLQQRSRLFRLQSASDSPPCSRRASASRVFDCPQQALRIVARIHQQLRLLGRQRADRLLQQQMQVEPHARQRRLQFVADRGRQVALDLVQQAEARHVAEHHRRPERIAVGVADGQDLRQVGALLAVEAEVDGLIERLRRKRLLLLQGVGQRLAQRRRRLPGLGGRPACRIVGAGSSDGWPMTPSTRRAAGLAISTWPPGSTTKIGSGKESRTAWPVRCARSSRAECDWR